MIGPFDPATYPGERPAGPSLVVDGRLVPVRVDGPAEAPLRTETDAAVLAPGAVRWVVAYGANAAPARLVDKGLDRRGAVLLPALLAGYVAAFEARRTRYGAVPLTLVPRPDAVTSVWVLGVHRDDTDTLDDSEGSAYELGRVGEVAVADRFRLPDALAYLPAPGTLVQQVGDGWRTWPEHDQATAAVHVDAAGPTAPAPLRDTLGAAWRATPLDDLPLFLYGSLQPGAPAWDRIAELVEVIGAATTTGRLYDTGRGWPAATDGDAPIVGTLVAPRDHRAAVDLLARADAYEGAPELFHRTTVRAEGPDGRVWAVMYRWTGDHPPGRPIPDGRWSAPTG